MKTLTTEQLKQVNELQCCLRAISGFLMQGNNLDTVDRGDLGCLFDYFLNKSRTLNDFDENGKDTSLEKAIVHECFDVIVRLLYPSGSDLACLFSHLSE